MTSAVQHLKPPHGAWVFLMRRAKWNSRKLCHRWFSGRKFSEVTTHTGGIWTRGVVEGIKNDAHLQCKAKEEQSNGVHIPSFEVTKRKKRRKYRVMSSKRSEKDAVSVGSVAKASLKRWRVFLCILPPAPFSFLLHYINLHYQKSICTLVGNVVPLLLLVQSQITPCRFV